MERKLGKAVSDVEEMSSDSKHGHKNYVGLICYWLPLVVYAITIALISSLSAPKVHLEALNNVFLSGPVYILTRINDKLFHLAEYTVLGLLTYRAIRFSWGGKLGPFAAFITVIAVTFYGITDEFHQWFVPLRQMEGWDLMADIFGGLLGVILWEWALTIPAIRLLEEQIPLKLQVIRTIATSKF